MRLPAILTLIFIVNNLCAQETANENVKPLILIDTLQTYNESMILHPSKFISVYTLNAQKATALYGISGRFGLIKIQTLPDIQFVRLAAIFDKFNVEDKYRNLRVCIDRSPVAEPEKLLADLKEIRNVEIVSEKEDNSVNSKDLVFINIVTQPLR